MGRCREAQAEQGREYVSSAVRKGAVLGDLEAVQLDHGVGLWVRKQIQSVICVEGLLSYNLLGSSQLLIFTATTHLSKSHLDTAQERLADFDLERRLWVIVIIFVIII